MLKADPQVEQGLGTYRAVMAYELGGIENYALQDVSHKALKPGQIRIDVKAAGVSFVDMLVASGKYQARPQVPFIPGSECAGVVTEIGPETSGFHIGQKVIGTGWAGMYAESTVLDASVAWPAPEGLSFAEAAVSLVSYITAWHGLVDRGQCRAGETLLVLGAAGATGIAAIQIARHLGAKVIASASSEEKRALALKAGADEAIDARDPDWRGAVRGAVGPGRQVDIIFDGVGGSATEPAFRTLGFGGRHLVVGFASGMTSLPTNLPLLKAASLVGVNISQLSVSNPERARAINREVLELAGRGVLKSMIGPTFPLDRFRDAMETAASGTAAGRIILSM